MKERELRFGNLPSHLRVGDIWITDGEIIVVVSSRPAEWSNSDMDVYGHIHTWYTIREATVDEVAKWNRAVEATQAIKQLRKSLGVNGSWKFDGQNLNPPENSTRMLDSYDDRWEPPKPIQLNDDQIAIETEYRDARTALKAN